MAIAGLALGCGVDADEMDPNAPPSPELVQTPGTVLNEVELDNARVTFEAFETEGGDVVIMRERTSTRQSPWSDRLLQQRSDLTLLEAFYALAPEGAQPHERLVESHAREVAEMGRVDASVQTIAVDLDAAVEKLSTSSCSSSIYSSGLPGATWWWGDRGIVDNASGFTFNCLDNNCGYYTAAKVIGGFCNDGSVTQHYRAAWDYNGGSWDHTTSWWAVPAQTAEYTTMAQTSQSKRYSIDGKTSNPGNYHTRTGVLKVPVPR